MLIKKFEGQSLNEILRDIKKEFGKDAVILSTEEKNIPGSQAKYFDVRAAIPEAPKQIGAQAKNVSPSIDVGELEDRISVLEKKLDIVAQTIAKESSVLRSESSLKGVKSILYELLQKTKSSELTFNSNLLEIEHELLMTNMDRASVNEMLLALNSEMIPDPLPPHFQSIKDFYKSFAIRWLLTRIHVVPKLKWSRGQNSFHLFVGPSGGGKTTLLAKLCAYYKKEGANIAFLAFDNKRIGATEHLRVFSKILNVPMFFMADAADFGSKRKDLQNFDLVLIDTAGLSPQSEDDLFDLKKIKNSNIISEIHLVLSLCEKETQLEHALRVYSSLGLSSLMFTKLDETWTYGEMFNLSSKWSLPLSFFSTGPQVPEDIEIASKERVIERILQL